MKAKKLIAAAAVTLMALAPALSQAQGARMNAVGNVAPGAVAGGFTLVTLIFAGSTKGTSGT
jgi:hypothetical protein